MATLTVAELSQLNLDLQYGNTAVAAAAAEMLAEAASAVDPEFIITVYDYLWNAIGTCTGDVIENSGRDPRNDLPTATLKLKGDSEFITTMMNCRTTMVGITIETEGLRWAFYVDTHDWEENEKGEWTGVANLNGIWDILNFMYCWPDNLLPIEAQPISYSVFIGPLVSCINGLVATVALRLQSGLWDFVNNSISLNPDLQAWFAGLLSSNGNILEALKTPLYVSMMNPLLDTSEIIARTVRMESCGAVIKDITRAYGVDCELTLWLPGDDQPDPYANLDQPTYVFIAKDREPVTGPTGTILDSVLKTVVDIEGSVAGNALDPILNPQGEQSPTDLGIFVAPTLGVNYVPPWTIFIANAPGKKGSVYSCKISDHTPKGYQHIIGGRSPQWLNDMMNDTFSYIIDSISILIGFTGIPSDLLSGFMNNAFLAFELWLNYPRMSQVGPYHPAKEVFHATASAPFNVETIFGFINAFFDSRGYTVAQLKFRNGEVYTLGKDIFKGALASVAYMNRTLLYTDYVYEISWKLDAHTRDVFATIGDGKAKEAPLAKAQRLITGVLEIINVLTLAPQGS